MIRLPPPETRGGMALAEALAARRSTRDYAQTPITLDQLSQLLWAAQGITGPEGLRTAPSAGAFYPLELHLAVGHRMQGLDIALWRYHPRAHALETEKAEDFRTRIAEHAFHQHWIARAPLVVIVSAVIERTAGKYRERAGRYMLIEAGHAAQNLLLQATALGLGGAAIGAFHDDRVAALLGLPPGESPLYIATVGFPA